MEKTCACGAIYLLTEYKTLQRDKDSIECDYCGRELIHWNGGCIWVAKLISRPKSTEK